MNGKFLIIDTYSLANRAFFALPPLATADGQPTNAVYGMAMMTLRLLDEVKPDYILAALDAGAPTFRHQQYEAYKGQRLKMEDSLRTQIPIIKELLGKLKISTYEQPGLEADDIIGTMAKQAAAQGLTVEIVTGDKDAFQLVEPNIMVRYTKKGITEIERVDETYIRERYQLSPGQLIELKGLMGDASDNIPGVPGFGEKTALKYLQEFASIPQIYEHLDRISRDRDRQLLAEHREQALLSRQLATIVIDADLPLRLDDCRYSGYASEELLAFCQNYEFRSLVKKLAGQEAAEAVAVRRDLNFEVETVAADAVSAIVARLTEERFCIVQFVTEIANWVEARLLGIGLGGRERNYFIPIDGGRKLPEPVLRLLADPEVVKVGYDLKKQMQIATHCNAQLRGVLEDVLLAGYLAGAGVGGMELESLAETWLNSTLLVWQNERGTRFPIFGLPETLPPEVLAKITGGRLEAIRQLRPRLDEVLGETGLTSLYRDVELPLLETLFGMEREGIRVEPEPLRAFGAVLKLRQTELEQIIYALVGQEFNIGSPKQLAAILYDRLGLKPGKKTKTGFSTDAEALESLAGQHPVIPLLLEYRQNTKLQTTYIDSLIALINPRTGRVHTTFNQAVTTTGRLSSTDPNLQNIPIRSEEGRMIRRAFVAESGHILLAADYSQIELRVMAHFSQDERFMEAFLKGEDIHSFTAAAVHGVAPEAVTREMRDQAKAVNFGIIYGISGFGLAKNIGVSRKEADAFIASYFDQYPGVKRYVEELIEAARAAGEARTLLGRVRKLPDLTSRNFTLRSFAERMARNTPIQGTAADIIKLAMVKIDQKLREEPGLGRMLLQVHDELVFEVAETEWQRLGRLIKREMEAAVTLTVPLVVDLKKGSNWGEMSPAALED
jgi:DNA polymerase-1